MFDPSYFRLCKATPLAVIILNGKQVQENTMGFLSCTEFPNTYASEMQSVYNQMTGFDKNRHLAVFIITKKINSLLHIISIQYKA